MTSTSSTLTLRPATPSDAPAIAALHTESWRDAYADLLDPAYLAGPIEADRLEVWGARLAAGGAGQVIQVAETPAKEVVGFICAVRDADPLWGSLIDNLHVAPSQRGARVGEKLLRSAVAALAERGAAGGLFLWVFEANTAGLRFYERLGGCVVGKQASRIAAAHGKPSLRVHWPDLRAVAGVAA